MAISPSVIRIGPTFGNFNAAKKRQPLIQRKLASTPVITPGNGGLQGDTLEGISGFFLWFRWEANRNAGNAPIKKANYE